MANATGDNAKLQLELSQSPNTRENLTKLSALIYQHSAATIWSNYGTNAPSIVPNGVISGGIGSVPASGSNDVVDCTALSCYLLATSESDTTAVTAGVDLSLTRPITAVSKVNSVTVSSAGSLAVVVGVDGSTTAFSETRGAAGAPPWIPTGSIELFQVRMTSDTAAPIVASEIYSSLNIHREQYSTPGFAIYPIGDDSIDAYIKFESEPPAIHSDDAGSTTAGKLVSAVIYSPVFSDQPSGADFTQSALGYSQGSTPLFQGGADGTSSKSLSAASWTAILTNGITDNLVAIAADNNVTVKYFPDQYKAPYRIEQGKCGVAITNAMEASTSAAVTLAVPAIGVNRAS